MKKKLSTRFWFTLALFGLMGQIAWVVENMYLNVFMYKMFNASASDISAMVAASAIAATLTTVLIGALSDRIGKRKVFMCGGYILWGISIFAFALIKIDTVSALFPAAAGAAASRLDPRRECGPLTGQGRPGGSRTAGRSGLRRRVPLQRL